MIRHVLIGGANPQEVQLHAINRRGKRIGVRVVCTALVADGREHTGVILIMEPDDGGAKGVSTRGLEG